MRPSDVAAADLEADVVDGHEPAEGLARGTHLQQRLARRGLVAGGRLVRRRRRSGRRRRGSTRSTSGHRPSGANFSTSTRSTTPKTTISQLPEVPMSRGSHTCSWSSAIFASAAPVKAPQTLPHPAEDGHEQVLDAEL
jgi:hypothetical protein